MPLYSPPHAGPGHAVVLATQYASMVWFLLHDSMMVPP
eukprot:CAMPEP_0197059272 /NCGR_PEP_ID=MMETSP1384-20130603/116125_1 /TAXON_ID=29189 /ORGANISM="Ammonia sp." /LENGTH=37 /DNA_ID= /DNA_START= /DNA_END= /DNA_ORIENTATION=